MFGVGFKPAKLKAQLQLSGSRIKVIRTKKQNQLVYKRRDIGQLLASGQEPRARIRVEDLMREENTVAAYDILELYCELLVTRMPIIETQKTCPQDLKESVASIIWAAPRAADLPELMQARNMFLARYGKDFIISAEELRPECGVSRMIINRLSVRTPSDEEKLEKLKGIAEEQKVEWDESLFAKEIENNRVDNFSDIDVWPEDHHQSGPPLPHDGGARGGWGGTAANDRAGSWVPAVAEAAVAAVTAHALGKHFDDDVPLPPPPPFKSAPSSAPGKPTEMFIAPDDYDRRWGGDGFRGGLDGGAPPTAADAGLKAGAGHPRMHDTASGGAGYNGLPETNPIDYPKPPSYLDGKVLPRDPMDYAPSVMGGGRGVQQGQGVAGGEAPGDFPSVPRPAVGTESDARIRRDDEFSHTSVFQRKKEERERQMREIEEAGRRAKMAAERAAKAAGMSDMPPSAPAHAAISAPSNGRSGLRSDEFPTPPQGFVGASAFDDFVEKEGQSDSQGVRSGGSDGISLPSPPRNWGQRPADAQSRPALPHPPPPPPAEVWGAPSAPEVHGWDDCAATHAAESKQVRSERGGHPRDVGVVMPHGGFAQIRKGTAALCRALPEDLRPPVPSFRAVAVRTNSSKR